VEQCPNAIAGDVLDYTAVAAAMAGHDAVVNTIMAPILAYGGNGPGFTINVSGVYNLLEAARVKRSCTRRVERSRKAILCHHRPF